MINGLYEIEDVECLLILYIVLSIQRISMVFSNIVDRYFLLLLFLLF